MLCLAWGCTATPAPEGLQGEHVARELYPDELEATERAWVAAELPDVSACLDDVGTLIATEAYFAELCPSSIGRVWRGCLVFAGDRKVLVVRERYQRAERAIVVHEATHALEDCAGLRGDVAHADPRLWGDGGVVERARAELELEASAVLREVLR